MVLSVDESSYGKMQKSIENCKSLWYNYTANGRKNLNNRLIALVIEKNYDLFKELRVKGFRL